MESVMEWQTAHKLQPEILQQNAKDLGIGTCVFSVELSRISTAVWVWVSSFFYTRCQIIYLYIHLAYLEWHIVPLHAMSIPFPYRDLYKRSWFRGAPSHEVVWHGLLFHPRTKQRHFFAVSAPVPSRDTCCFTASRAKPRCRNCPRLHFLFESWENQQKW